MPQSEDDTTRLTPSVKNTYPNLERLLAMARARGPLTYEEKLAQSLSWVAGQCDQPIEQVRARLIANGDIPDLEGIKTTARRSERAACVGAIRATAKLFAMEPDQDVTAVLTELADGIEQAGPVHGGADATRST